MRTKLIAAVVTISLTLVIGWYVVAQETFPFGPLPLFTPNSVLTSQQLNAIVERINAMIAFIENNLDGAPQEIVVNCPTDSLAAALQNADEGDTIKISGTCTVPVTIFDDGLTLDGQGSTILDGGGQPVITVEGAHGVRILNLTARNGLNGILARRGASVTLEGVTAEDNANQGIRIDENSTAHLINCTAQRNGDDGIFVFRNSSATFEGAIVSTDNGGDETSLTNDGISVVSNSNAFFNSGAVVTTNNNVGRGITISLSSSAFFFFGATATANSNGTDGIGVSNSSSLFIVGSVATITASNNGNRGIEVSGTSTLSVNSSTVNTTGNASDGIGIFGSSRFQINDGSTVLTENNTDDGLVIDGSSTISTDSSSVLTTRNNTGDGFELSRASSASLLGTTTVTDNGVIGFNILGSSSIVLSGTTLIQNNDSFGVLLNRGSDLGASGALNILNNADHGLLVNDGSAARLFDGVMIIDGNTTTGISVIRTSQLRLAPSTPTAAFSIQIHNNGQQGILISENSNARLESSTTITGNAGDGLRVQRSSDVIVFNTNITGNRDGIDVDDSSAEVNNSSITGHGTDVRATFGSRLTLNSNTIGTIACDDLGILSRGTDVCPF